MSSSKKRTGAPRSDQLYYHTCVDQFLTGVEGVTSFQSRPVSSINQPMSARRQTFPARLSILAKESK
jgi:hypothetical protein